MTVPDGVSPEAFDRLTSDHFTIYERTADSLDRLLRETRPERRGEVLDYVRRLLRDGTVPEDDRARLARRWPELRP
jgi:hypothetical protein